MNQQEIARITAVKSALIHTTGTQGWLYIKKMANNVVQKTVQEALDEEDRDKGEAKRLKAASLQKGFAELFSAVEVTKGFDIEQITDDDNMLGALEDANAPDQG
jgi:hypothetical protein